MIKPITKEYFHSQVSDGVGYRKICKRIIKYLNILDSGSQEEKSDFRWSNLYETQYFEKPGEGFFAYIDSLEIYLIPESYPDLEISEDEEIDFSDWDIEVLSKTPNPDYTLNCVEFGKDYSDSFWAKDQFKKIKSGDYRIKNDRIGFSIDVTIIAIETSYDFQLLLGYPEKLEVPRRANYTKSKDRMIKNMILWSQKDWLRR